MTRDELIQKAYLFAMRKATAPAEGTDKFDALLGAANAFIEDWQNEPNTDWNSLWQETNIGTVTATNTFALDTAVIRKLSNRAGDKVRITWTDGTSYTDFEIVSPNKLSEHAGENVCARVGNDLKFARTFASTDAEFGGTITAPNYGHAAPLVDASDEVPVDQPMWLVYMVAAEWVRNDYTKSSQYANLLALAKNIMDSMKANNTAFQSTELIRDWTPLSETF